MVQRHVPWSARWAIDCASGLVSALRAASLLGWGLRCGYWFAFFCRGCIDCVNAVPRPVAPERRPISAWCGGPFLGLLVGRWFVLSKASLWREVAREARRKEAAWLTAQVHSSGIACHRLTPSVTFSDSSPRGRAKGTRRNFPFSTSNPRRKAHHFYYLFSLISYLNQNFSPERSFPI